MKHRIDISGRLIPNSYKWYFDWLEEDSTCPRDVKEILDKAQIGDEIEVYINSPGGIVDVGSEIYTMLRSCENVKIFITGQACSAASVIAMAAHCVMSPTALMMIHCAISSADGNRRTMEHMAETLSTVDKAICTAYMAKTGMDEDEILAMMERETWLTADQAKERKFVDGIMFEEEKEEIPFAAGPLSILPTQEQMNRVKKMIENAGSQNADSVFLLQQKLNLMKLKGEKE